jgi:hypothetical protein
MPASVNASSVHNTTNDSSLQTFNVSSNAVPLLAISDFARNFLYLYILIISFYFGSRYFEDRRNADNRMEILRKLKMDDVIKDKDQTDRLNSILYWQNKR